MQATKEKPLQKAKAPARCADFDEDCADLPNKLKCFLYDPRRGACPYLSSHPENLDPKS